MCMFRIEKLLKLDTKNTNEESLLYWRNFD
jgi:hypothetical protein